MTFSRRLVFIPRFSGELEFRALPDDLVTTLESRIQEGFLVRGNHTRSNYRICSSSNDWVWLHPQTIFLRNFTAWIGIGSALLLFKDGSSLRDHLSSWLKQRFT